MINYKSLIIAFLLLGQFIEVKAQNSIDNDSIFESYLFKDFVKAKSYALNDLAKNKKSDNDTLLLGSYSNLSEICYYQKINDSSFYYCELALKYALKLEYKEKQADLYNRNGSLEKRKGNYNKALELYQKALKIAQSNNFNQIESEVLNNTALIYKIRGDEEKAIQEIRSSIKISKEHNYQKPLARSYNILGFLYYNTKKDSSIYYYEKSIKLSRSNQNDYLQGVSLSNLGDLHLNRGNYKKAFENLNLSESLAFQVGNMSSLHFLNLSLGIYYEEIDNYPEAINKYEKAIKSYGSYIEGFQKLRAYWLISGAYFHNNEYKKAFEYQEKYIDLNEGLLNAKKAKEFDKIRTEFDVEKKDNQIVLLEKENELAQARKKVIIVIALLVAIALGMLLLYYRHRVKTQKIIQEKEQERFQNEQELVQVKALIEGQDKERHRMAKELHDGLGGQLASANLTLSQVNSELQNPNINSVTKQLSSIFKNLRLLSHNLSANYFNDKVFGELLLDLKQQYEHVNQFKVNVSIFPEESLNTIDADVKHNLYRILQELFNNASKHSNCNYVELSINRHSDSIVVIFEDDGIGFDAKMMKEGIGLKNINERAKSINSTLVVDSQQGKGTQITLEVPI